MGINGIWLASASERRAILLGDLIFEEKMNIKLVNTPLIEDEIEPKKATLKETVFSITKMKMKSALLEISLGRLEKLELDCDGNLTKTITLVSDTLVEDPDSFEEVFGKPSDKLEAVSMLKRLSGRKHKVWSSTGIIVHKSLEFQFDKMPEIEFGDWLGYIWTEYSTVEIKELSDEILFELIDSNSWNGKAGAYDLDGPMSKYAEVKNGEKFTVLGIASIAIDTLKQIFKI
ncbi:MAG: hypothetical protein CMA27_01420 [Euryarchaeota archaeon]|nr:hypothetical protein [Euryarchaeota archaeon]